MIFQIHKKSSKYFLLDLKKVSGYFLIMIKGETNKGKEKSILSPFLGPCIEIKDLKVSFDNNTVLDKFSLKVEKGEKLVLTGPSGIGKSTILKVILGFIEPESGNIKIMGERLSPHSVWQLRRMIGYVPQEPELGRGSVKEWLERPFTFIANKGLKDNLRNISSLFHQFLLTEEILDKNLDTLSGGEKQRIAIISTILLKRPILLLDEPTSALDDRSRKRLIDFLRNSSELTVLMVSHDRELLNIANSIITLS